MKTNLIALAVSLAVSGVAMADFGADTEAALKSDSLNLFGFNAPVDSSETVSVPRVPGQNALDLIKLADGLNAEILTRQAGHHTDMMVLWPNDTNPSFIITCVEGGREVIGKNEAGYDLYNPAVQRINVKSGKVSTILRGMDRCDGIRRTPWGTVVVTEETDDGGTYEILDPTKIHGLTVAERNTNQFVSSKNKPVTGQVAYRGALGNLAYEGLDVGQEGVMYYGDEERPGSYGPNTDGGALFKFVPSTPWDGQTPVTSLDQSPFVAGNVYAFQASCRDKDSSSFPQFGQGCEIGQGAWVKVDGANARTSANANHATGYYRPEDGHFDINYAGPGYKFCWANTGNSDAENYAEVVCLTDTNPMGTGETTVTDDTRNGFGLTYLADSTQSRGFAYASANRAVEGDTEFNAHDNLAFQPGTGNMYVIEDTTFGDVWVCLPDGADRDIKSDGCVRMLSVRDESAEPTGFFFSGDGKTAWVSIQHSDDSACFATSDCEDSDQYGTDDLVKITGFKVPAAQ